MRLSTLLLWGTVSTEGTARFQTRADGVQTAFEVISGAAHIERSDTLTRDVLEAFAWKDFDGLDFEERMTHGPVQCNQSCLADTIQSWLSHWN